MSDKMTLGNLRIKCRFPVISLLSCHIDSRYGECTRAEMKCMVKGSEVRNKLADTAEEKLEIVHEDEEEEKIFTGVIQQVELLEEGQQAILSIGAVSYLWKMDIEKKSRSFQNLNLTYKEVAEMVIQEYGADMQWNVSDRQLNAPLIQYQETDYCFLRRIISHVKGDILTEDFRPGRSFDVGLKNGSIGKELDINRYVYSCISFKMKEKDACIMGKYRIGYEIKGMDLVRAGDCLQIDGKSFYVMDSHISFDHNDLNCVCQVFEKQCFEAEKIPADTLKGTVLTGKILKTGQEKIRLHLDIDKEQAEDETYAFFWKPVTGNLLYCMPEEGTKAALYFEKADESTGTVIYNIRENGEECGETSDYHNRYFTTKDSKSMYLKPSEMGLLNMSGENAEIVLKDVSFLQMKTTNKLSLLAEGRVQLKGKNVTFTTPKEATLVKKDLISSTVINLCNAFDAIGKSGNFAAGAQVEEKKRRKPISSQVQEEYSLQGAVAAILSNIPAEGGESAVLGAIAGSMPVVTKLS